MTTQLGRLERVTDLREIWKTEATHFTPWLAREEGVDNVDTEDEIDARSRND